MVDDSQWNNYIKKKALAKSTKIPIQEYEDEAKAQTYKKKKGGKKWQ